MTAFDAVIIGAGHNGLACAAHLGARGWRVGVFDGNERPGGAVKTLELTAPGFRHDWGAMNLSLFAGSPFHKAYGVELAALGLAFSPVTHCFASAFPDGRWLGVSTDLAVTKARIASFSSRDAETWEALVAAFPARAAALFRILGSPMKQRAIARTLFSILRAQGFGGARDLGRFLLSSPRAWLDETFESDEVKAMLGAWGMHLDFAPDIAGGALFPYLEGMANQSFGMALGRNGAGAMVDALVALVNAKGGAVECSAPVETIEVRDGKATGVVLADGRRIEAHRAVIGGIAPRALGPLLPGGTGDARFDRRMRDFRHAAGTLMIHLALDDLPTWPDPELRRFAYVHLAPTLDAMALAYTTAQAGLLPAEPVIVVGQPTTVDPGRAPEGKHVLWIQVRMVPAEIRGDASGVVEARDWDAARETYADHVLTIVERYAPGLRDRIIAHRVFSPLDLERENPNLVGGDQICGSHHLAQNFLFRPAPGAADWRTPVRNLFLTGAATWPGAGVGAGSGYMLARELAGG
jgi:phytoene dehydrogenase-like protein